MIITIIIIIIHLLSDCFTPSPPTKSLHFRGFDSSRLLILRGGSSHVRLIYREPPGKFDSRTLSRKTLKRWTGRTLALRLLSTCFLRGGGTKQQVIQVYIYIKATQVRAYDDRA